MKKIVLSLAGVLAATAFAPEASALPAFARQTGMACNACHQQHFPVLNGFGRAFKAAGYTMMGAQEKVEAEHLSIPATLNAAILLKYRYQQQNNGAKTINDGAGQGTGNGQWQIGDEFSLFFGGRVAENIGFIMENNVANVGGLGNIVAGLRLPVTFDMGGAKLSVTPFTTDALGISYGYELSSAGVMRANRWAEQRRDTSAIQFALSDGNGTGYTGAASGFAFVAQNDMGYINYTRWSPNFAMGANGGAAPSFDMKSNYLRIAATPTVGDWAFVGGIGMMSGTSEVGVTSGLAGTLGVANSANFATKGQFADVQAHGQLGGNDFGAYFTYAKAPAAGGTCGAGVAVATGCNAYNEGAFDKKAWALGADYSVIPHTLHLGASYRNGTRNTNLKDNAWMVQAIYDLAQNVAVHAAYSSRSGSHYTPTTVGKNETLLMLEASW